MKVKVKCHQEIQIPILILAYIKHKKSQQLFLMNVTPIFKVVMPN